MELNFVGNLSANYLCFYDAQVLLLLLLQANDSEGSKECVAIFIKIKNRKGSHIGVTDGYSGPDLLSTLFMDCRIILERCLGHSHCKGFGILL